MYEFKLSEFTNIDLIMTQDSQFLRVDPALALTPNNFAEGTQAEREGGQDQPGLILFQDLQEILGMQWLGMGSNGVTVTKFLESLVIFCNCSKNLVKSRSKL